METDYIKTHMVIERYVQGKLSDDEEAAFEERLVWDQALQEEVDLAEAMRSWLLESARESQYSIADSGGARRWIPGILMNPGIAAAASFVLGMLIAFPMFQGADQGTGFDVDESASSIVIPLLVTRSANRSLQQIPVTQGGVTLLLVDVPNSDQRFNVVVTSSASGAKVWSQSGLSVGYLEAVAVGLPGAAVPPGEYTLAIEAAGAEAGFRQDFSFQTVLSE